MGRLRLPSTVTRPQSAPSANVISNFREADFWIVKGSRSGL